MLLLVSSSTATWMTGFAGRVMDAEAVAATHIKTGTSNRGKRMVILLSIPSISTREGEKT